MSNDNIKVELKEYHRVTATFKFLFPKEDVLKEFGTLEQFEKEIESIKDSTYTKTEMNKELRIMGLEAEKRMIQATDRKLMDVQRQTQIEEEINTLKK